MISSCFFCQSLLSDFLEGLIPDARRNEIKKHLEDCASCRKVHQQLTTSVKVLNELPSRQMSQELVLQITEASEAGKAPYFSRKRLSRMAVASAIPLLLLLAVVTAFPQLFPWFQGWRAINDESNFNRYFPLLQGAGEIVEEQANWLIVKEPLSRSLWEEGGLSPEEFEKSFQGKANEKILLNAEPSEASDTQ